MSEKSASKQIDEIIEQYDNWQGALLKDLRALILQADPRIVKGVKWKMLNE